MLTVSQIALSLSSGHHPPSIAAEHAQNCCIYCGVALADIPRGVPVEPMYCPIPMASQSHEWRQCAECANVAACLYYYAGNGRTHLPHPKLAGAGLDIYVWILRENPQDQWTAVPVPLLALRLRYTRSAISHALARLHARGLLYKRPRTGRYGEYKPLIWQRPKGE